MSVYSYVDAPNPNLVRTRIFRLVVIADVFADLLYLQVSQRAGALGAAAQT